MRRCNRRRFSAAFATVACISLALHAALATAQTLVFEGVLGNSGEQGPSLVRMSVPLGQRSIGMGVVCDRAGALWDRGGAELLNRYAPDGRLLAQYRIPKGYPPENRDLLTMAGDSLVLRLGKDRLFTLPVDAPPGTEVLPYSVRAELLSFGCVNGRLAAVDEEGLFLFRVRDGAVQRLTPPLNETVYYLEMTPDGAVYVQVRDAVVRKFLAGREVTDGWPRSLRGERWAVQHRLQLLGIYWYAQDIKGTIARFDAALKPDPGVVLGGASGWFIGHLQGNFELNLGRGMVDLGADRFAVSGFYGILHLLHWQREKQQFVIVRRIGALPFCMGLALDRDGNIRCNHGCWRWADLPDTPIRFSGTPLLAGPGVMLDNDRMVARAMLERFPQFFSGRIDGALKWASDNVKDVPLLPGPTGVVVYRRGNDRLFVAINAQGQGQAVRISSDGEYQALVGPVRFQTASPVNEWTTLAIKDDKMLLAAADGQVLELSADGENWKEQRRWNMWGAKPDQRFGDRVFLTASDGRLWISDTSRHRVLCFQISTNKLLASFGRADQPGNDLVSLNGPEAIAACGNRAVVYDAVNQRLVRLRLP